MHRKLWPIVFATFTLSCLAGCPAATGPNLVANGIDVIWDDNTQAAIGYISNRGQTAAGPFLVYFNALEAPESERDRPQVTQQIQGLAPGEKTRIAANFTPLATRGNFYLEHVNGIELLVNPKAEVVEENTLDNDLTTPLPAAVSGADEIQGSCLRPSGFVEATAEIPGQTLTPEEPTLLAAVEVSAARPVFAVQPTDTLTLTVRVGDDVLASVSVPATIFPAANAPGPITGTAPSQQIFVFAAPIELVQGVEHTLDFTTSGPVFRMGTIEDFAPTGHMIVDDHVYPGRDLTLKLFIAPSQ